MSFPEKATIRRMTVAGIALAAALGATGAALADWGGGRHGDGRHGGGPGPAMMIETMFERVDADGDGRITAEEIAAAESARVKTIDPDEDGRVARDDFIAAAVERARQMAERRFASADSDGDGFVDRAAFERGPRLERMMDRMDADGDGVLTREEAENFRPFRHRR